MMNDEDPVEAAVSRIQAELLPRAGAIWDSQTGQVPLNENPKCHLCSQPIKYPPDLQWYLLAEAQDTRTKGTKIPRSKLHVECHRAWEKAAKFLRDKEGT